MVSLEEFPEKKAGFGRLFASPGPGYYDVGTSTFLNLEYSVS